MDVHPWFFFPSFGMWWRGHSCLRNGRQGCLPHIIIRTFVAAIRDRGSEVKDLGYRVSNHWNDPCELVFIRGSFFQPLEALCHNAVAYQ